MQVLNLTFLIYPWFDKEIYDTGLALKIFSLSLATAIDCSFFWKNQNQISQK